MFCRNDKWKFDYKSCVMCISLQTVLVASESDYCNAVQLLQWVSSSLEELINPTFLHVTSVTELGESMIDSGLRHCAVLHWF